VSAGLRLVTDYTAGVVPGQYPGLRVVGVDESREPHGDPPARRAYLDAFLATVAMGEPLPVLCLVGPYGYSAAFTAAAGARNDLGGRQVDPNTVRVINPGRSFLGLGVLAEALLTASPDPGTAARWLDDAAPRVACWAVCRTEALAAAPPEAQLEVPEGFPDEPWSLVRVRLAGRLMGGFASDSDALGEACVRMDGTGATGLGLVGGGDAGLLATIQQRLPAVRWQQAHLPAFLRTTLGAVACLATGPTMPGERTHA